MWLLGTMDIGYEFTDVINVIGLDLFLELLFFSVDLSGESGFVLLGLDDFGLLDVLFFFLFFFFQCVQVLSTLADVFSQHFYFILYLIL